MLRLTETQHELMRIGVMAAQQTLTLLVEVRVLYPELNKIRFLILFRSVAQLGRALRSGRRGRVFESRHSDF